MFSDDSNNQLIFPRTLKRNSILSRTKKNRSTPYIYIIIYSKCERKILNGLFFDFLCLFAPPLTIFCIYFILFFLLFTPRSPSPFLPPPPQLMEASSASEAESVLRSACAAAEPWAAIRAASETAARRRLRRRGDGSGSGGGGDGGPSGDDGDLEDYDQFDEDDDLEEDFEEQEEEDDGEEIQGGGGLNAEGGWDVGDRGGEEEGIGAGWTMVVADDVLEEGEGGREGGAVSSTSKRGAVGKVELGERERARTAEQKERLKAGIF